MWLHSFCVPPMTSVCVSPPLAPYPPNQMEKHPVCKSPPPYTASRQSLVSIMVIFLYLAKLLKEKILTLQEEPLLHEIKEAVCSDYRKLEAFAVILCKGTTTDEIRSTIIREWRGNDELIELNYNDGKRSNSENERITIVVDKEANETIAKDVRRLSSAIFEDLLRHVKLDVIREGNSFTITCSFPLILSEQLLSVAHDNIDKVLQGSQVKRLTIGYYIDDTCSLAMRSDEQQFTLLSPCIGLLKQQMDSVTLMKEAESLKDLLDTEIEILDVHKAESDEFKLKEYEELKETKEILEEQLALFQSEKESNIMAYGGKPEWDDYFEDLNEKLPSIASAHKNTASEAKELVGEAQNELSEIRESDKVKKVPAVEESFQHLNDVVHGVHEYIDKVDDLYWKLQKQTPDVIQDLKQGKSEKLKKLIVDIEETIQNCKEKYDLFLDRCKEFTASCDTAERRCRRLQEEAEDRKTMTQVGGGVATVGVAVAGTAISIIAGVLTGGIGAAVGLPLTAAAATATGATTAVAAHVFGKAAESFRKLSRRFSRLQSNISSVQNKIAEIDLSTNEYTHIRSMVRYRMNMTLTECREVAEEMKETERISKELYPVTTRGLKNVADAAANLRREFNRTF